MAAVRHLEFLKFGILVTWLVSNVILLLHAKFHVNRTINRWDIPQKTIFNMAAGRHIGFAKFWYFATWLLLEPKSTSAHNISLKSDDPRLRYSKKTFSKWRPSAILNFRNLVFWSHDLCLNMIMLLLTEFRVNRAINRRHIAKKRFSIWQPSGILDLLWRHHISSGYSVLCS